MTSTKQLLSSRIAVFTVVLAAILSVCAICFGAHQTAWAETTNLQLIGADGKAIPEADATAVYDSDSKTVTINAVSEITAATVAVQDDEGPLNLIVGEGSTAETKTSMDVPDGKIAANGSLEIKLADNGVKAPAKVVFSPKATKHTITVESDENGSASASPNEAATGEKVTLTATPKDNTFVFDKWVDATEGVTIAADNTFDMIDKDVTVKATFKAAATDPFKVNVSEAENGTVETDVTTAKAGDTVTITATPDKGYKLVDDIPVVIDADGTNVDVANVDGTFTFTMPKSDVTVSASFQKEDAKEYTITIEAENGKVDVSAEKAAAGVTITLTPKANDGYKFDSWKSDQVTIKDNKFEMPAKNVAIVANFVKKDAPVEPKTFEIVVSKTDAKTGAPLSGAEFELKNADGKTVDTWTTDGSAITYKLDQDKKYILTETKAPEGYSREKDINIVYTDGKVMIDQGAKAVELKKNDDGFSTLNVKDMNGSGIHANTTSPKTGDNAMPMIIGAIVVVAAAVVGFAAYRKSKANKQQ